MRKSIFIAILLVMAFSLLGFTTFKERGSKYLNKPQGPYHVGYKEYHLVNKDACPSLLYNENNKASYSDKNPLYCNEIEMVVYYPTTKARSSSYKPIPSLIADVKSFSKKVTDSDIKAIKKIRSYSAEELKIADKKFPVLFFSPGYGVPVQLYENLITELVSHGYLVVGVNSQFLSGELVFNPLHPSKLIDREDRSDFFKNNFMDLQFVYKVLSQKKSSDPILDKISWNKVGLLGHSLGAAAVARFANQKGIRAVAALDLTLDLLLANDCHEDLKTPLLHIFSSDLYAKNPSHEFPYLCKANESEPFKQVLVIEGNNDPLYSMHMSFCDYSTLQYNPPIKRALCELNKNPQERFLGTGNGISITQRVNKALLAFFAQYL